MSQEAKGTTENTPRGSHAIIDRMFGKGLIPTSSYPANQVEFITFDPQMSAKHHLEIILTTDIHDLDHVIQAGFCLEQLYALAPEELREVVGTLTAEQIARINKVYGAFEIARDDLFMDAVLCGNATRADQHPLQQEQNRRMVQEIENGGIHPNMRVAQVGSGWPLSAISYLEHGISTLCGEVDPRIAEKSIRALEALGLYGKGKIRVICANGRDTDFSNYDLVVISAMVSGSDTREILKNASHLKAYDGDGPEFVVRTTTEIGMLLYQPLPPQLTDNWPYKEYFTLPKGIFLHSVRLLIRVMAAARRGDDRLIMAARSKLITV